jgi:hypothetical protein
MAEKTPVRVNYDGNGNAIGFAELQSTEFIGIDDGGTGAITASGARTALGIAIGFDVQGYDSDLATIAGLSHTDGAFIVSNGSAWTVETGATARTSLGLGTSDSPTFNGLTVSNDLTVSGNLTVNGTQTILNTETLTVDDNLIVLNDNVTGSPTEDAGIEIERGTSANKTLLWNETDDKWTVGTDTFVAATFEGNLTGNVTGQVTDISNFNTDDLTEGSVNLYFTDERVDDRVASLLVDSTTSGIDISYDDVSNSLTISTDLTEIIESLQDNIEGLFVGGTGVSATYDDANNQLELAIDFSEFDSGSIVEGSNLFFTEERVDDRISALLVDANTEGIDVSYDDAGNQLTLSVDLTEIVESLQDNVQSLFSGGTGITATYDDTANTLALSIDFTEFDTDDLVEGTTNIFYTEGRFDTSFSGKTTTDLTEGNNLYFTEERVDDRVAALLIDSVTSGIDISYDDANNQLTISSDLSEIVEALQDNVEGLFSGGTGITTNYDDAANTLSLSIDFTEFTSDEIVEGSTNLFVTDERIDDRINALLVDSTTSGIDISYDDAADSLTLSVDLTEIVEALQDNVEGLFSGGTGITTTYDDAANTLSLSIDFTEFDTDDLVEGTTNVFYTESRFDTSLSGKTTDDLAEGTAQYFTTERAQDALDSAFSAGTQTRITYNYDDVANSISLTVDNDLSNYDNTNTAFIDLTDLSATTSTGVTYDNTTGVIALASIPNASLTNSKVVITDGTTPSDLDLGDTLTFTGGTGVTITNTSNTIDVSFDAAEVKADLDEYAQDAVIDALTSGTQTRITVGYDDNGDSISLTVDDDLANYDNTNTSFIDLTDLSVATGSGLTYNSSTGEFGTSAIPNSQLENSSVTINANALSLGGTLTLVTDDIAEDGSPTNLWYTDARVGTYLTANSYATETYVDNAVESENEISEMNDVTLTSLSTGEFLQYNGSAWVNIDLDTDDIDEGSNLFYTTTRANTDIDARVTKSFVDALNVDADTLDGNDSTAFATAAQGTLADSSLQSGDNVSELVNDANYIDLTDLSGSTGVTYDNTTGAISIGQAVGTTDNVTFNNVTVDGILNSDDITATTMTVSNDLVVTGDLTVQGTTTTLNTDTVSTEENMMKLASGNIGNSTDIGIYGKVVQSSTTKYVGLHWDPGTGQNKFKLFDSLTVEPGATVDTADASYTKATLVADIEGDVTGALTGNADTATALASGQNFSLTGDVTATSISFDGTGAVALSTTVTESAVTQHESALTITESQISDLQSYLTAETNDLTSAVTWANVPDANITESSVTQHQAALSINESQITFTSNFLENLVEDLTPQLGGTLDANGNTIDMGVNVITDTKVGQWDTAYSWGDHASAGYLTSYTETDPIYTASSWYTTTNNSTNWDTAYGWGDHSAAGYLTSFTEINDLTAAVTWANVPDTNITESSVTQHEAALSITESQISDLGSYITATSSDTFTNKTINFEDNTAIIEFAVTVSNPGAGNKYYLDGELSANIQLIPGVTYRFDQSDSSNSGHPLVLSTTSETAGVTSYTTAVTTNGTPGSAGAYTQIVVDGATADKLYYYCSNHSGMGGGIISIQGSSFVAGTGIDISGETISVDSTLITSQTLETTTNNNDLILIYDDSASALRKMSRTSFLSGTGVGSMSSFNITDGSITESVGDGNSITFSGTSNEIEVAVSSTDTVTIGLPSNVTIGNNLTVTGDLTVSGTTTTVNTETINLADNQIVLNSNATGSASEDGGIEIERGDDANKTLIWDESIDKWTVGSETFVAGTFEGNLTGNVTGNLTGNVTGTVSSISNHDTDSLSEGSSNLYYTSTRANADFDTKLSAADTDNLSEGSTNLYYTNTRADARIAAASIDDLSDVDTTTSSPTTGQALKWDGSAWIPGDASSAVSQLSDVTLTSLSSDEILKYNGSAWVNTAFNINNLTDVNTSGAQDGQVLTWDSSNGYWKPTSVSSGSGVGSIDVELADGTNDPITTDNNALSTFTTSDLAEGTNLYYTDARFDTRLGTKTTDNLTEGSTNLYFTNARVDTEIDSYLSGGTGVSISSGTISIGQAVSTTSDVTFNDLIVSGDLTVSGTTTTVDTETINLADNIILINSNETGTPSQNGGIEIERGTSTNKTFLWDESTDKWTVGSETIVAGTFEGDLTGNVTATSVLADGVTATTQSSSDNSTKVATTAYVDTALSGISSSAIQDSDGNTNIEIGATTTDEIDVDIAGLKVATFDALGIGIETDGIGFSNSNTIAATATIPSDRNVGLFGTVAFTGVVTIEGQLDVL